MSDDFDNDFSWLSEDDDTDSDLPDDELPEFDWADEDSGEAGSRDDMRLGMTGELSWRQESDTSDGEDEADEDHEPLADLAALRKSRQGDSQPESGDEGGDFMDDMPDWMQGIGESEAHENETSQVQYSGPVPAWMREELMGERADDTEEDEADDLLEGPSGDLSAEDSPETEDDLDDEIPPWLQVDYPAASDEETGAADDDEDEVPEWLAAGDSVSDDEDEVPEWMAGEADSSLEEEDVPEWMASATEAASGEDFVDKDGDGVPDWMQEAGVESATYGDESNDAYDEEPDDDEAVPDWMGPGEPAEFDDEDTALPNWMAQAQPPQAEDDRDLEWLDESPAFDELEDTGSLRDDEAVSDWMASSEPEESAPGDAELPPWLAGADEEELDEAPMTTPADYAGDDDEDEMPDWIAAATPATPEPEPSFDDMFSEVSFDDVDDDDFDLLGDFDEDSEEFAAVLGEDADDEFDLLGALTGGVPGDEEEIPDDDLLAAMLEAEDEQVDDELDAYIPSPEAETLAPDDDLSALIGDDEDVFAPADDAIFEEEFDVDELEPADLESLFEEDEAEEAAMPAELDAADELEPEEDLAALFEDEEAEAAESYETPPTAEGIAEAFEQFETEISDDELDAMLAEAGEAEGPIAEEEAHTLFDEGEEPEVDRFFTDYDDHDDQYEDWFGDEDAWAEEPAAAAGEGEMEWLEALDEGALEFEEAEEPETEASEADARQLTPADEDLLAEITSAVDSGQYKLDNLLDSLNRDESLELPRTGELPTLDLLDSGFEFDRAFDSEQLAALAQDEESGFPVELSPDAPDWLREMTEEAAGAKSAAAIVRRRKERPIEDLPESMQFLHERTLELPASPGGSVAGTPLENVLGNVKNTLAAAAMGVGAVGTLASGVLLTDDQRERAQILQQVAGSSLEAEPVTTPRRRRLGLSGVGQALIGVLLALLMIVPFVRETISYGELPPASFAEDTRQFAFVERVQSLFPGQQVLVAIEYGPTGAAELDEATQTLLLQILRRGAMPVLVGGNPIGLLHANNILEDISEANGGALVANRDYVVGQYIVGDAIGLRNFNENIERLVATDINGDETNLSIDSLDDFNLIVIVTESADTVRQWAEQVKPTTDTPMMAITNQAAAPLSVPYIQRNPDALAGMLVGYGEAYTYREMVTAMMAGELQLVVPTPTQTDTPPPTSTPTEVPAVVATDIPTETPTTDATETPQPSDTPIPTQTTAPGGQIAATSSASPTATDMPTATDTPTVTPTRASADDTTRVIVVEASTPVNVRSGPSTLNSPVAVLQPGDEALIIGANDDESWYNILLDNAVEGWIAASVVRVEEVTNEADDTSSDLIEVGVVISSDVVNVRSGPGTGNPPVGSAQPGDVLPIIGRNADESWYNVRLDDGTEGWIAAFLLRIEMVTPPDEEARADFDKQTVHLSKIAALRRMPEHAQAQDDPTPLATDAGTPVEATEEASRVETTVEPLPELNVLPDGTVEVIAPPADTDAYRDERWFSTTIGVVAVVVIIVVGNIFSIIRALLRRRGN